MCVGGGERENGNNSRDASFGEVPLLSRRRRRIPVRLLADGRKVARSTIIFPHDYIYRAGAASFGGQAVGQGGGGGVRCGLFYSWCDICLSIE